MTSLVRRPLPGCLGIVIEAVLLFVVAGVVDLVSPELTGVVMLAFLVRWIYALVTSPALPASQDSSYMLVDQFEHRHDDAPTEADEADETDEADDDDCGDADDAGDGDCGDAGDGDAGGDSD